ncbi:M14 metallopeptidase family protein [Flaviaesturariibacter amylovorans]|uniref:M14 family metallopeptidase n=1 Tax=Flaviaesturariibacter amylovorans TaxID=1084520 RepID=A0ABP8H156_9BACT
MHIRFRLLLLVLGFAGTAAAQVPSPEQFLGYRVGTRYTPHHRIVAYFQQVAAALPSMVKLEPYGQTNEGRPLMVAYVSAPENIARLEAIRANNLGLAQQGSGSAANAPVIVWLSYNVHGNEPSSSEAALLTLQALTDRNNTSAQQWLKNTVVVIDPCLNPDGRDRYVNWFNSVVGKDANATLAAREHSEPWPGGRVNHYYFDLNRDWAWQTQAESQARVSLYQRWLPQIHVDFHEQGINNPYYFAPAAQPYHEVITPFQRSFQETIGKNHARYFDARGWLYFTREVFDLFYPSYGDTYPLYNGSIGMTYEQAGGPQGGLAAATSSGDTLTLADRALHHHTTGMSTIEVAAQNASRIMTEYGNYYRTAVTSGHGAYKSYVVRGYPGDAGRLEALKTLLDKNGIRYGFARGGSGRGYNYDSRREETFTLSANDLVVSSLQPKSALVRVLFEPDPKLVDSATYDITAWSLPYVYGLRAYASRDRIDATESAPARRTASPAAAADPYGYVIRWDGMSSVRLAGQLMRAGVRIRFSERTFELGGERFERGSLIVLRNGNAGRSDLWNTVRRLADSARVALVPVTTGLVESGGDFGSTSVRPLTAPKVALISGEGTSANAVGEVWHYFEEQLQYPVTLVNSTAFGNVDWSQFNVIIMPNGNYRFLNDKTQAEALRSWVSKGGRLIALENAVAGLAGLDWGLRLKKTEDGGDGKPNASLLRRYENRERDELPHVTPGSIYRIELDNSHPLAFGYPGYYYTLKQDDRNYEFLREGGWNVGVLRKERPLAGFVGARLQERLQDALVFGVQDIGRGNVVYFTDDVLFRNFWENGKLLFANAVFLVGQ